MPARKIVIAPGSRFGRLTAIGPSERKSNFNHSMIECRCECGGTSTVRATYLNKGRTSSCGCTTREAVAKNSTRHGMYGTPTHRVWMGMLARCRNPRANGYDRYGGRGIKVCERWLSFGNFYADMGERPTRIHSLGREDNDGNYEPDNVRWETPEQQYSNKVSSRKLTKDGQTFTIAEWSRRLGIGATTIHSRLNKGWAVDDALMPQLVRKGWR